MARKMKDSGIEWIGKIPEGWETKRLGAILQERNEVNNPIQTTSILSLTNNRGVIPYSEKGNQGNKAKDDLTGYKIAHIGDIVLNSMNVIIGSVGLSNYYGAVSPVYYMLFPRNNIETNIQYYNYLFQTTAFQQSLRGYGNGILEIRMRIQMQKLKTVLLPVPTFLEQSNITVYLDASLSKLNILLSKTRSSIEEYKKLKQAVITQAVTKGVRGEREMKDSGVEWIGTYPSNWKIIKIKWLLHERKDRSVTGLEEPLSMSQKKGLIPTKDMDSIPNMASSFIGAKLVYKGDLVFNKLKAHLGVFSVSKYNGLVSPDYAVYYSTGPANLNFLELLFKTPQYINEFKKKSSGVGAGLTRLYTGDLYSIYCALPPLVEQEEIADYLDIKCTEIERLIAKKEQLVKELESYKKSLIYEVVTGKREV